MKAQLASMLALSALGALSAGTPQAGSFDPPDPEIFARPQDRDCARLLMTPCTEADVGHGCYRYDGRISRETPCIHQVDPDTIGSLPTDQCYKMEAARRYRGVWVDEFEGQRFVPEGARPPPWPRDDPKSHGWREEFERPGLRRSGSTPAV